MNVGDTFSYNFTLPNQNGELINLQNYKGKYLVLYFYPKDDTPACTKEACEFRDFNDEMSKFGVEVVGVSKDSAKSHKKFENKFQLNFALLSDEDHKLQDYFGVWKPKKFMGREFLGTHRTTFLINPEGKVLYIWENVEANGHAKEVWEKIKEIMSS